MSPALGAGHLSQGKAPGPNSLPGRRTGHREISASGDLIPGYPLSMKMLKRMNPGLKNIIM